MGSLERNTSDKRFDNIPIVSMRSRLSRRADPGEALHFDYEKFHETVSQVSGSVDYNGITVTIDHSDYPVLTTTEVDIDYEKIIPKETFLGRAALKLLNDPVANLLITPYYRRKANRIAEAIEENTPYIEWDGGEL